MPLSWGVRADPQPAAVLELPSGLVAGGFAAFHDLYMYYQTAHGKFLLEGTVARPPAGRRLVMQSPITDFLQLPHVKYAVIHYDLLKSAYPESRQQAEDIEKLLQTQGVLLSRDDRAAVYRLITFRAEEVSLRE